MAEARLQAQDHGSMNNHSRIIVISGMQGAGETTVAAAQHLREEMAGTPHTLVMLTPSLESVKERESGRGTQLWERWGWMGAEARATPSVDVWVDSTGLTVEETVDVIMSRMG